MTAADDIQTDHDHGEPRVIAVYDGRQHLGNICIGRSIRAVTPDGVEIGKFATREEARAAIVRAAFDGGAS